MHARSDPRAGFSHPTTESEIMPEPIRPGSPDWPRAWVTYHANRSTEQDIADLQAHGVSMISCNARNTEQARTWLDRARRHGMKLHIHLPDITEHADLVAATGCTVVSAVMIGGVYQGKAIDRHLFTFTPQRHSVIIEPPVYDQRFAYTRGSRAVGHSTQLRAGTVRTRLVKHVHAP